MLTASGQTVRKNKPIAKAYEFTYISMLFSEKKPVLINWGAPRRFQNSERLVFKMINDSTITREQVDQSGKRAQKQFLIKTPVQTLKMFKSVPRQYLDFELIDVYNYRHLPLDIWSVLYYSKKRNALLTVEHAFELNRITGVILYMSEPNNPFKDFNKYFVFPLDSVYQYPVIKQKINLGN